MKCPECGFEYCQTDPFYASCLSCDDKHTEFHADWLAREEFRRSIGLVPDKPMINLRPRRDSSWCQACEERIGVTEHVCKKKNKAIDYLDLLKKLP